MKRGLKLISILTKQLRHHDLLRVVNHEVKWAQIVRLALQVALAPTVDGVTCVAPLRMLVIARNKHDLQPLILLILLVAVDEDIVTVVKAEHATTRSILDLVPGVS